MKNKYSLLNYNMDDYTPTIEFTTTEQMIDSIIEKLASVILKNKEDINDNTLVNIFYGNFHYGSIQDASLTGNAEVDEAIAHAVESLNLLSKTSIAREAGIGDTATDEDITQELYTLIKNK